MIFQSFKITQNSIFFYHFAFYNLILCDFWYFFPKAFIEKVSATGLVSTVQLFPLNDSTQQVEHFLRLWFIFIERVPGIMKKFGELPGCHVFGMVNHFSCIVMIPVMIKDPVLLQ